MRLATDARVKQVVRSLSFAPTPAPERPPARQPSTFVLPDERPIADSDDRDDNEIQVILRIRPLRPSERNEPTCILPFKSGRKVLRIRPTIKANHQPSVKNAGYAAFKFTDVFDEQCTQDQIFETTALPMVADLFRGESGVVLAYGVTCSGKTWTIQGDHTHPGILPRALDVIVNSIAKAKGKGLMQDTQVSHDVALLTDGHFRRRRRRVKQPLEKKVHDSNYIPIDPDNEYHIFASYIEVYQEKCYDLFDHRSGGADDFHHDVKQESMLFPNASGTASLYNASHRQVPKRPALKLKGDYNGDVQADGKKEVQINSRADIDRLLEFGKQNRTVAHTNANEHSSRSHAIFMITLKQSRQVPCDGAPGFKTLVTTSQLQIVDLAGSERTSRTNNSADRVKEAKHINTSLMNLGRCLTDLRRNQLRAKQDPTAKPKPVPFRCSSLTRLLQDSLTSGRAALIVNVSPVLRDADETIQALRSASIARQIRVSASRKRSVLTDRTNLMQTQIGTNGNPQKSSNGELILENQSSLRRSKRVQFKQLDTPQSVDIKGRLRHPDQYVLKAEYIVSQKNLKTAKEENEELRTRVAEVEKEIRILKGELEESILEANADRKEADGLFEENLKLKERLVDAETRFRTAEVILRDEIATEAEKIIKEVQEQYERRIRDQEDRHLREISQDQENRRRVDEVTRRLARASLAAFDGIALNFPSNQDDDRDETCEELSDSDFDSERLDDEDLVDEEEDFEEQSEDDQT
ncbi:Kinesin-like Protein [Gracilaria domingensis]|nr:Kinesin-like Protein [Gracilaria domingensis]